MARILVVDDEASVREIFAHFLTEEGHDVVVAKDGMEALHCFQNTPFDVIVSDIRMPNLSGTELHSLINQMKSDVQVILITGEPTVETATAAIRDHALDYLVKPIKKHELCQSVARALTVKQLREEKRRVDEENERIREHLENLVKERTIDLERSNQSLVLEVQEREKAQQDLRQLLERLKENLDETTNALILAIEKRDPYTAGHQERVARLAVTIAKRMQLPQESIDTIHTAASIHDVGKIKIPAEILSKPGSLEEEEMALIRKHPRVGYDIVNSIHFFGPVAKCVRQHHERWNGSGYPDGLQSEQILLEADRKSTRLNSSHTVLSRMPSSA